MLVNKGDSVFDMRYGLNGTVVEVQENGRIIVSFDDKNVGRGGQETYLKGGVLRDGRKVLKYFDDSLGLVEKSDYKYLQRAKALIEVMKREGW